MGDYHIVYKDLEGASTEWDDIQRKFGNLPPKPAPFKPPPFSPSEDTVSRSKDKSWIDDKTQEVQEELEDDLQEYRRKRLAEMKESARVAGFGSVVRISGSDYVRKVSETPLDIWVIVTLYKDGYPECELLLQCLEELARTCPETKFVKIISTDCIPDYPDHNLPTVLVCKNNVPEASFAGLHSFGRRCTAEGILDLASFNSFYAK